jgi:transcriptional regulator with PAS, ATPase and Fis domain
MLARQAGETVILGESKAIRQVLSLIDKVAPTDATVLLQGESGVGKELVAKAIHFRSKRRHKPFVKVSCAAIPESLLEVELFGREKGAYTDATDAKPGRFELAHQGTMLLDEVGDLTPAMQAKLLRVLQEKEFERVGGTQTIRVDVRIIAATNKDLLAAVQKGEFREDLFYRLNVVPIYIPPLRERKEDIPILAEAFVARFCAEMEKPMMTIADDAMQVLLDYDWPGNVRELQNVLERAVILAEEPVIRARDLHFLFAQRQTGTNPTVFSLRHAEMEQILRVLKLTKGNKAEAARLLGITRDTLYRKLREYRLDPSQWKP